MNALIIINEKSVTKDKFTKALKLKNCASKDYEEIKIIDLLAIETPVKYLNWLKELKYAGDSHTVDAISSDDSYSTIIVIGDEYNLPYFKNCGKIVKYRLTTRIKEEQWN